MSKFRRFLMGINTFRFCHFESYYEAYLCFLPWQAVCFLQVRWMLLYLNICGTAYPVSNLQRILLPVCSGLS